MKIFLAGVAPWRSRGIYDEIIKSKNPYILESFYYADADTERLVPYYGDFILDSGAFTFMENSSGVYDWDKYLRQYADFINRNDIKNFMELDVDFAVGYETVLKMRDVLEKETGKKCIPVWHSTRGIDEFKRMCDEYDYVAVGGLVAQDKKSSVTQRELVAMLPALIREAHLRGSKIHGLGFTRLSYLNDFHFDSVDSSAWTAGNRFGIAYQFDRFTLRKKSAAPSQKIGKSKALAVHNFTEWIKFQKWADNNL